MMDFIDIYCERRGPELWDEPLNAATNLVFFLAALLAFDLARQEKVLNAETGLLVILIAAIGAGSLSFHTLATAGAMLADTLPILMFQVAFLLIYSFRVMLFEWKGAAILLGAFFLTVIGFGLLPQHWLNGSIAYIPALLFLSGLGVYHFRAGHREPHLLLVTTFVFAVSLTFRTLDMALCPRFLPGTHFLWHIMNGFVLYLAMAALILNYRTGGRQTPED